MYTIELIGIKYLYYLSTSVAYIEKCPSRRQPPPQNNDWPKSQCKPYQLIVGNSFSVTSVLKPVKMSTILSIVG